MVLLFGAILLDSHSIGSVHIPLSPRPLPRPGIQLPVFRSDAQDSGRALSSHTQMPPKRARRKNRGTPRRKRMLC
jgi:hypothetical protein